MAKSRNNRGGAPIPLCPGVNGQHKQSRQQNCHNSNIELTQDAIDRHWDALPPTAKSFIIDGDGHFSLSSLIKYWSSDQNVQCCTGGIAGSICGATWYLALVYLKLGMLNQSRSLTINGAFIHQCYNSSIEHIKDVVSTPNLSNQILEQKLPYFVRGFNSIRSPETMERFIRSYLPKEYTQMMTSFANLSTPKSMRGYVDQISNDWSSTSHTNKRSSPQHQDDGAKIKIVLVGDADETDRRSFDICPSTTLKSLFNDYADKSGVSLRLLRFSFGGKTLFLSSAGSKTPEELGMNNQDTISVHDMSKSQDSSSDGESSSSSTARKSASKKKAGKKSKGSKKKTKKTQPKIASTISLEEYKVQHSQILTKIHDEAEPKFKAIRQKLNTMALERTQPKKKNLRPRAPKSQKAVMSFDKNLFNNKEVGLGGKAGKSHYAIQVGEVSNLYKTTKPNQISSSIDSSKHTLDLHGYTQAEALTKLDESLQVWNNAAMCGSYPFVQPAVIVCGCGNQVLSEVVEKWIKVNDNVSNAPKRSTKRRGFVGRAA